jgi:hypothetical protein
VGADTVPMCGRQYFGGKRQERQDPTGVEEQGMQTLGSYQEPGRPCYLRLERPV